MTDARDPLVERARETLAAAKEDEARDDKDRARHAGRPDRTADGQDAPGQNSDDGRTDADA